MFSRAPYQPEKHNKNHFSKRNKSEDEAKKPLPVHKVHPEMIVIKYQNRGLTYQKVIEESSSHWRGRREPTQRPKINLKAEIYRITLKNKGSWHNVNQVYQCFKISKLITNLRKTKWYYFTVLFNKMRQKYICIQRIIPHLHGKLPTGN